MTERWLWVDRIMAMMAGAGWALGLQLIVTSWLAM